MAVIDSIVALEAIYGSAEALAPASVVKVADHVAPGYRRLIEASPFCALSTVGPEGLDCSPRGDRPGFVRVADPHTLVLPDRRGNNRIDSLRNVVRDPRVALMFLIPGSGNAVRVNGRAHVTADPDLLASFAVDGKAPRTALVVRVVEIYFQCARAIIRSRLWEADAQVDPTTLPSAGEILAALTAGEVGGETYDRTWRARADATMW